jgi:hypothetical protein
LTTASNVRRLRRPATEASSITRRLRANWRAELRVKGSRVPCSVVDISGTGANLRIDYVPEGDVPVWLVVENMAPIQAEAAWRNKQNLGVRFLQEQGWVGQVSEQRFDPAAWLRD